MSIPTGGLAALLVVATLALSSCGSDGASVTTTTTVSPATATQTATQTVAAETTTQQATQTTTAAPKPAQTTTQKTQTTKPASKPAASKPSAPCPSVDVGVRDGDIAETYARIVKVSNVSCATVTYVVQQWGGQRIGAGKALLPLGWDCSGDRCSKGSRSVTFVLEPPSNSD